MESYAYDIDTAAIDQPGPMSERRDPVRRSRPGGRSARVRQAIHAATIAVLLEHGYESLTIAEIAKRAHVHETSIYRRWRTKAALVLDVLLATADAQIPIPDTGSLRDDLVALLRTVAAALQSPLGAAAAQLSISGGELPEVAAARREYWRRRFERAAVIFERAERRGELRGESDPFFVLELLIAPLFLRGLVTGGPLDNGLPARIVEVVLAGLRGGP
jgi:AcrR family transcriptional regulator